jgi:multidrug efflux pump
MRVLASALAAAHLRFRPIVMTSMAFILGVTPLAMASGAGSAAQRAIGTGVIGGMIVGTILAVFFVPLFFVVVRSLFKGTAQQRERAAEHATEAGITAEAAQHYVDDAETGLSDADRRALNQGGHNAATQPKDHP